MIDDTEVIKFVDLINNITKRPGMYLVNRVEDFELVFLGYELALKNMHLTALINGFKLHVNKWSEFKIESSWAKLIRFYSSTDLHSIELFSKLFKEYIDDLSNNQSNFSI